MFHENRVNDKKEKKKKKDEIPKSSYLEQYPWEEHYVSASIWWVLVFFFIALEGKKRGKGRLLGEEKS